MMNVFKEPVWEFIEANEKETIETIDIIDNVEVILQNLWSSVAMSKSFFNDYNPQHSSELFITTYYIRNIFYLLGSYQLAKQGLVIPSHNLQRTAFETLVKGYLFIVEEDISDMNFIATHRDGEDDPKNIRVLNKIISKDSLSDLFIDSAKKIVRFEPIIEDEQKELIKHIRKYSSCNNNIRTIYCGTRRTKYREFYREINVTAHPSVQGVFGDICYNKINVVNSLGLTLLLAYGNIKMYLERFFTKFNDPELSKILKDSLNLIEKLESGFDVEPNKDKYQDLILFKEDNFRNLI